jgi:hypothetical protein
LPLDPAMSAPARLLCEAFASFHAARACAIRLTSFFEPATSDIAADEPQLIAAPLSMTS